MPVRLSALAQIVGGTLVGDASLSISGAATLDAARPDQIAFLDSVERAARLSRSKAGAVVVPQSFVPLSVPAIQVADVHKAFATLVEFFRPPREHGRRRVNIQSIVGWTARLGDDVHVEPGALHC